MAQDAMGTMGAFSLRCKHRNSTRATVELMTNNTSDPDGVIDEGGILDPDTVPAYSATGIILLTLKKRWRKVRAYPRIVDTTAGSTVRVNATVEGVAAANTVTLAQETAHVATATNDKRVYVDFELMR